MNSGKKELSSQESEEILKVLKTRFEKNMNRHVGIEWVNIQARLDANANKLWSLNEMDRTGGEPDVIGHDKIMMSMFFTIVRQKVRKTAEVFVTTKNH